MPLRPPNSILREREREREGEGAQKLSLANFNFPRTLPNYSTNAPELLSFFIKYTKNSEENNSRTRARNGQLVTKFRHLNVNTPRRCLRFLRAVYARIYIPLKICRVINDFCENH